MIPVSADLDLVLVLGGDRVVGVPTTFRYSPDSPYAVTVVFRTSEGDVTWVVGRDLLVDGLTGPAGEGDVCVWPSQLGATEVVCISLESPAGAALLEADAQDVYEFLDASAAMVPFGSESMYLDLDSELAVLLGDDASPLR